MKFSRLLLLLACSLPLSARSSPSSPASPSAGATSDKTAVTAARHDPFTDPLMKQIATRQSKAVAGDMKETQALTADLKKWFSEHPDNHLLEAYLGSLYTLCSRDAWPGPGKLTFLRDGNRLLDRAVSADPQDPAVRFIRAVDFYELPGFFGKHSAAQADFQLLVQQADGRVKTPYPLDTTTAQAIYYYAGLSLKQQWQEPKAREVWQRGWKLDPSTELAKQMQGELAKSN